MNTLINDPLAEEGSFQQLKCTNGEAKPASVAAAALCESEERRLPPLFNRATPQVIRQREKPSHRAMVELAAKGWTPNEISRQLGMTATTVQQILNQPYAASNLANEIHENFGTDHQVVELIKESVVEAVTVARDIMRDEGARKADRLAAANLLLERRYGKANQPINRGTEVDLNNLPDTELAKMITKN